MSLILASGSPRRRALLEDLGVPLEICPTDVDETPHPGEDPAAYVERLAIEKGAEISCEPDDVIVSADTIVAIDGQLLGKPKDEADAAQMLRTLSGRMHQVLTGVAVRYGATTESFVETTIVRFAELTENDIAWYISTGEPTDKAGAYAMQGRGGLFVTSIDGSYDNVIGLPRYRLRLVLDGLGENPGKLLR